MEREHRRHGSELEPDPELTEALERELEEGEVSGRDSNPRWSGPYRASGAKHGGGIDPAPGR